jgi:AcrR family transcriptional regulator
MAPSVVEPRLIMAAIELYGEYGFKSVSCNDLAKGARCAQWNVYRLFGGKKGLYKRAIEEVVAASMKSMAELALTLFSDKTQKSTDQTKLISEFVHHWYSSLSLSGARLLSQARIDKDISTKTQANLPLEKLIGILEKRIEESSKDSTIDARTRAELLVRSLLDLKVTYAARKDNRAKENDEVNRYLKDWLRSIEWS